MDEPTLHCFRCWWRLAALPGVGPVTLGQIRDQFSSPFDLVDCSATDLIALGLKPLAARAWQQDPQLERGFEQLLHWQQQPHQGVLLAGLDDYPAALASLNDAPTFLWWRGQPHWLQQPCVALVGSRNPTPYARDWAWQCAHDLVAAGVVVVSGMALGIDGAAHDGALRTGATIAVLGCGADVVYPRRHRLLASRIAANGLILSEQPPGTAPQASFFPARNRIISGLCQAVVVAEAGLQSGTLITARLAASQGRDVMALPGAVNNPLSHGCHQLIRDGAQLVQNAAEILESMGWLSLQPVTRAAALSEVPALVALVDFHSTSVDMLVLRSGLPVAQLLAQLLELELEGWLQKDPGGYRRLR